MQFATFRGRSAQLQCNRWPFNLELVSSLSVSPSIKLWARELNINHISFSCNTYLSWCMVKIHYCFHAIGLLSSKNRRPHLSSASSENISTFLFFSSSSFKNDKQTSHHSFHLGPFPPDERKKPPLFSSLNHTSLGKVIVVSNSCIWYSTYILNAFTLREFLPIYTSIYNKL